MKTYFLFLLILATNFSFSQDSLHYDEVDIRKPSVTGLKRTYFYANKPFNGVVLYPYGTSHYSQIINVLDGKAHGLYLQFHKNGEPKELTNYEFGKRDGVSYKWYDNGQLQVKSFYEQGRLIDTVYQWHKNGQLKSWSIEHPRRTYTLEYHMFYETGQKRCEITQETQKRWHSNGQLSFKGGIVNNKSHGKLKYYNEEGKLIKTEVYRNGKKLKEKQRRNEPTN